MLLAHVEIKKNRGKGSEFVGMSVLRRACVCTGGAGPGPLDPADSWLNLLCLFKPPRASSQFNIVIVEPSLLFRRCKLFAFNLL